MFIKNYPDTQEVQLSIEFAHVLQFIHAWQTCVAVLLKNPSGQILVHSVPTKKANELQLEHSFAEGPEQVKQ